MAGGDELAYTSISELGPQVRAGETSAVAVARACLDRIARLDARINAFITLLEASALEEAGRADEELRSGRDRGPLHGMPIVHKDLFYTRGVRTTAGSKVLSDFIPDEDADVVARLHAAGVVLLGKVGMHEFAMGGSNDNPHYGAVHNPWDLACIPGGSSGGSAAALAAGFAWQPPAPTRPARSAFQPACAGRPASNPPMAGSAAAASSR